MKRVFTLLLLFITFLANPFLTYAQVTETIQITAAIPPAPSNLDFSLTASESQDSELSQNDEVIFTIHYRSDVASSYPITIIGEWEEGLIEGSGGTYVDVYDYVIGSATTADGGTSPTVDLINRRVTWNISSLTSSVTEHVVSFKLRVKPILPTMSRMEVFTNARATFGGTAIPEETYRLYIQPVAVVPTNTPIPTNTPTPSPTLIASLTPTPHPTAKITQLPGPTATSGPNPIIIITPSNIPKPSIQPLPTPTPQIKSISFEEILNNSVTIDIETNIPTSLNVMYGLCSQQSLNQKVNIDNLQTKHTVVLQNLNSNTDYCFRVIAASSSGKTITSDIFIVTTASGTEVVNINQTLVSWNNILLSSGKKEKIITPLDKSVVINVGFENAKNIDQVIGKFENTKVLGATTIAKTNIDKAQFIQMIPNIFSTEIEIPIYKGEYTFVLEVKDIYGSYTKKKLPMNFVVGEPLHVQDNKTLKSIENALVNIYRYEESTKRYIEMKKSFLLPVLQNGVFDPYHTDQKGDLNLVLPNGTYKFEVSAIGYKSAEQEVTIGIDTLSYPIFKMERDYSFGSMLQMTQYSIQKTWQMIAQNSVNIFSTTIVRTALFVLDIIALLFIIFSLLFESYIKNKKSTELNINKNGEVLGKKKHPILTLLERCMIEEVEALINLCLMFSVVTTFIISFYQGINSAIGFIIISIIMLILWLYSLRRETQLLKNIEE